MAVQAHGATSKVIELPDQEFGQAKGGKMSLGADDERTFAAEGGIPLNQLATEIDDAREGDAGLASAIRSFILQHFHSRKSSQD